MAAIYLVWAVMLWRASADSAKHLLFIDLTMWANAALGIVMLRVTPTQKGLVMRVIEGLPLLGFTCASGRSTFIAKETSLGGLFQMYPLISADSRGGTRTPDPVINSHLLYQLSYSGKQNNCNDLQRRTQLSGNA